MSENGAEFYSAQLLLAKSAKGAAAASLIGQVLEHPSVYVFGELLDVENVKALAGTAQSASLELLKCFAYGTWKDYRAAAGALPALSAGQAAKLKKLSVVTLASRAKTIAYAALMRELEMSNVREVEDLIIECFNGELLQGKIDQRAQQLEVHSCIGRDVRLDEVGGMAATLGQWHATAGALLGSAVIYVYPTIMFRGALRQVGITDDAKTAGRARRLGLERAGLGRQQELRLRRRRRRRAHLLLAPLDLNL